MKYIKINKYLHSKTLNMNIVDAGTMCTCVLKPPPGWWGHGKSLLHGSNPTLRCHLFPAPPAVQLDRLGHSDESLWCPNLHRRWGLFLYTSMHGAQHADTQEGFGESGCCAVTDTARIIYPLSMTAYPLWHQSSNMAKVIIYTVPVMWCMTSTLAPKQHSHHFC